MHSGCNHACSSKSSTKQTLVASRPLSGGTNVCPLDACLVVSQIRSIGKGQIDASVRIKDVTYLRDKLFAALKVPKAFMGYEKDLTGKATLAAVWMWMCI